MNNYICCLLLLILLLFGCDDQDDPVLAPSPINSSRIGIINDEINDIPIIVYGNEERGILKAFLRKDISGKELTFSLSNEGFPNSLVDNDGNVWSVLGKGASQNVTNSVLENVNHLVGYWFLFPAFYDNVELSNGVVIRNTPDSTG